MTCKRGEKCISIMNCTVDTQMNNMVALKNKIEHGKMVVLSNWEKLCDLAQIHKDLGYGLDTYDLFFVHSKYEKPRDYTENITKDYILHRNECLKLYGYMIDKFIELFPKYSLKVNYSKIVMWQRERRIKAIFFIRKLKSSFI